MMHVSGPNNVGRAVQMDPTLLRYASAITQQKKCWELLAQMFGLFCTTTPTNSDMQQGVQMDTTNYAGSQLSYVYKPYQCILQEQ